METRGLCPKRTVDFSVRLDSQSPGPKADPLGPLSLALQRSSHDNSVTPQVLGHMLNGRHSKGQGRPHACGSRPTQPSGAM